MRVTVERPLQISSKKRLLHRGFFAGVRRRDAFGVVLFLAGRLFTVAKRWSVNIGAAVLRIRAG